MTDTIGIILNGALTFPARMRTCHCDAPRCAHWENIMAEIPVKASHD